jgi:indolepyruvate ferredoxin oxidoreductase alpha subunit
LIEKKLLMGNEAIAFAAIEAGVQIVTGYPGTPSTEALRQ